MAVESAPGSQRGSLLTEVTNLGSVWSF